MLICCLTGIGCSLQAGPQTHEIETPESSRIVIIQPERDLGTISVGDRTEEFEIHNQGQRDLQILAIGQSCTCVDAKLENETIPPGSSTKLRFKISPRHSEQKIATVTIDCNDPATSRPQLVVKWTARGPLQVVPPQLEFGVVRPGVTSTQTLKVIRNSNEVAADLTTTLIARSRANITTRMIQQTPTDDSLEELWEVVLTPETTDDDQSNSSLVLALSSGVLEDMSIPVLWQVREPVEASPRSLFVGAGPPSGSLRNSVTLSAVPGTPLKVLKVLSLEKSFEFTAKVVEVDSSTARIEIEAMLPAKPGSYLGHLEVECESPAGIVLQVPVVCVTQAVALKDE